MVSNHMNNEILDENPKKKKKVEKSIVERISLLLKGVFVISAILVMLLTLFMTAVFFYEKYK